VQGVSPAGNTRPSAIAAMKTGLVVSLVAVSVLSCGQSTERVLLDRFFAASRLRDLTALRNFSTVVFEPASDGIITNYEITGIDARGAVKVVSISAPVKMFDGRTVTKTFAITIAAGMVTAISESGASPSTPPR
jgi:hypothetical protein